MRRDNIIHFLPLDCSVDSQVSKDLLIRNRFSIDQIKKYRLNAGEAMTFPGDKYSIFHLFVKSTSQENPDCTHIVSSLKSLKQLMSSLSIKTISISRDHNHLEPIEWEFIEDILRQIFNDSQYIITVCTSEIEIPPKPRRSARFVKGTKFTQQRLDSQCELLILQK